MKSNIYQFLKQKSLWHTSDARQTIGFLAVVATLGPPLSVVLAMLSIARRRGDLPLRTSKVSFQLRVWLTWSLSPPSCWFVASTIVVRIGGGSLGVFFVFGGCTSRKSSHSDPLLPFIPIQMQSSPPLFQFPSSKIQLLALLTWAQFLST